jgi:RNA-directed DNA polymerase
VGRARAHIANRNEWVVDLDLEKLFDRVNHDMLLVLATGQVA